LFYSAKFDTPLYEQPIGTNIARQHLDFSAESNQEIVLLWKRKRNEYRMSIILSKNSPSVLKKSLFFVLKYVIWVLSAFYANYYNFDYIKQSSWL
jgi:hypothetical protein